MITLPPNRNWTQTNASDVFGTLASTYNVNFDLKGYAQISPKSVAIYSSDDNGDFKLPLAIFPFQGDYFVLTSESAFLLGSGLVVSEISGSPNLDTDSDATPWQEDRVYVSFSNDLAYFNGSSWNNLSNVLDNNNVPHPLEVMSNFSGGHLVVGDKNTVVRFNTSHTDVATLTINENYEVTCLKYLQNFLYVGTRALDGGEAKVFVWNGSGTAAQAEYPVGASEVYALQAYKSSVVAVTSAGQILRFNGGGFAPLDERSSFPVYYLPYLWSNNKVCRRGVVAEGDLLYINIDGTVTRNGTSFSYIPSQPSGIWCYDPEVGLYCRHLSTTDRLESFAVSSLNDDALTISHVPAPTGDPVLVSDAGSLSGVSAGNTYYLIKVSNTRIKLALTPADAKAGRAITIGGTAGTATLKMSGYANYGYRDLGRTPRAGAVGLVVEDTIDFPEIARSNIMWGFENDDGAYLNILSPATNVGGFVVNKVWSSQVADSFQKVFVKYADLNLDHEEIVVRSRSRQRFGLPSRIVTGTFSTNLILGHDSGYLGQVAAGDTVHLLHGNGAGQSATITNVDGKEFHLDRVIEGVVSSDEAKFIVDDFTKRGTITESDLNVASVSIGASSSWNQLALELRGQNVKVEELQLVQGVHQQTQ